MKKIKVRAGFTIRASTGMIGRDVSDRMSTERFYLADKGTCIKLLDKNYLFNIATYSFDFDHKYIHTFTYASDEAWVTYQNDLSGDSYRQTDYIFHAKIYFRICLKRVDNKDFSLSEEKNIARIISITKLPIQQKKGKVFTEEVEKVAKKITKQRTKDDLVLAVLTDTHCTVNGTWIDTIANLEAVNEKVHFDAIVHLGDLTDGMVSKDLTGFYVKNIINDMMKLGCLVHIVLGNHDSNYLMNNPDEFTIQEQVKLYQKQSEPYKIDKNKPYYYNDWPDKKIRCIYLSAYDNKEKYRYGFDSEQLDWLHKTLTSTPDEYCILIFAHDAPLTNLDYWADEIRNSAKCMQILDEYQNIHSNILAYIHGHTHADKIYDKCSFPIVSIGCSKCEDMQENKPEGSFTEKRELNTYTQELWDTLIIKPKEKTIKFVRFGAGTDRIVK